MPEDPVSEYEPPRCTTMAPYGKDIPYKIDICEGFESLSIDSPSMQWVFLAPLSV